MDPFERYDMIFNGAEGEMNNLKTSPGRYAGEDNGWAAALYSQVLANFDQTIIKYPSIQRFPGGASNDLIPDLQHPKNPLPLLEPGKMPNAVPSAD
jgi:arylsulfatase